jgi:ubiquinone/menaquinone biosynthesis C-methylase UbiE
VSAPDLDDPEVERVRLVYRQRATSVASGRYLPTRPSNAHAASERGQVLQSVLASRQIAGLAELDILEIGCGTGGELARLVEWGADPRRLSGVDLRQDAVDEAHARVPEASVVAGDASGLPYRAQSFDIVYQAMALSSMPSRSMRTRVAGEMRRVVRPGGLIISYDFVWNPMNRDTVGIGTVELRRLFAGLPMEVHRVTLAPPIARWLGDRSERVLRLAARVAPLRSHRLVIIDVPG